MVVDGRSGERFVDVAAADVAISCGFGISPALELDLYAGALGQIGDGVDEGEGLQLAYELDGVAPPLAPETVVEALVRGDAERGGLLGVFWVGAETNEAGSLAPKGGELRGDLDYVRRLPDLLYAAVGDPQALASVVPVHISRCTNIPRLPRDAGRGNVTLRRWISASDPRRRRRRSTRICRPGSTL